MQPHAVDTSLIHPQQFNSETLFICWLQGGCDKVAYVMEQQGCGRDGERRKEERGREAGRSSRGQAVKTVVYLRTHLFTWSWTHKAL